MIEDMTENNILNDADLKLIEVKLLVPKVISDRLHDAKLFLGPNATEKELKNSHTFSKRVCRYLLNYHKLFNRAEIRVLKDYIDSNTKLFKLFDKKE